MIASLGPVIQKITKVSRWRYKIGQKRRYSQWLKLMLRYRQMWKWYLMDGHLMRIWHSWGTSTLPTVHKTELVTALENVLSAWKAFWLQLKNLFRCMLGVDPKHHNSYISEFLYRYNYCGGSRVSCCNELVGNIADIYRVWTVKRTN